MRTGLPSSMLLRAAIPISTEKAPVRDVTVRNTSIDEAETRVQIKHVERLTFDNVTINGVTVNATNESNADSFDDELTH